MWPHFFPQILGTWLRYCTRLSVAFRKPILFRIWVWDADKFWGRELPNSQPLINPSNLEFTLNPFHKYQNVSFYALWQHQTYSFEFLNGTFWDLWNGFSPCADVLTEHRARDWNGRATYGDQFQCPKTGQEMSYTFFIPFLYFLIYLYLSIVVYFNIIGYICTISLSWLHLISSRRRCLL